MIEDCYGPEREAIKHHPLYDEAVAFWESWKIEHKEEWQRLKRGLPQFSIMKQ